MGEAKIINPPATAGMDDKEIAMSNEQKSENMVEQFRDGVTAIMNRRVKRGIAPGGGMPSTFPTNLSADPPKAARKLGPRNVPINLMTGVTIESYESLGKKVDSRSIIVERTIHQRAKKLPEGSISSKDVPQFRDRTSAIAGLFWSPGVNGSPIWMRPAGGQPETIDELRVWPLLMDLYANFGDLLTDDDLETLASEAPALESLRAAAVKLVEDEFEHLDPRQMIDVLDRVAAEKTLPSFTKTDAKSPLVLMLFKADFGRAVKRLNATEIRDMLQRVLP